MAAKLGVRLPSMWAAKSKPDVSVISDLVTEGLLTDIARDERAKMGDAFRQSQHSSDDNVVVLYADAQPHKVK